MEICECERRFETLDCIEQHIKATRKKGLHRRKTPEEIEARRKEIWAKSAKEFEELANMIALKCFNKEKGNE